MERKVFIACLVPVLFVTACTSESARVERTTAALAALICEGDVLATPQVQKDHVDGLKRDPDRASAIAADREALLPQLNLALSDGGVTDKDVAAFVNAVNDGPNRNRLVDAMAKSVNDQCPETYLQKNTEVQYAIAAFVVLYADPKLVR